MRTLIKLISAYAPTLTSSAEAKDMFYEELSTVVCGIPASQPLYILGDFNARIGADHDSWMTCLGHFGVGRMNDNGQRMLEFCCHPNLCITNTFFNTKPQHKVSWRHPRSNHWHQLDLILTRRSDLPSVKLTRTYHSADCDTDHSMVGCRIKISPKKLHHTRKEGRPRINTAGTQVPEQVEMFTKTLQAKLSGSLSNNAKERWEFLRNSMHSIAIQVFGKKKSNSADWFEANAATLMPLIDAKRRALAAYKASPSQSNLLALRSARSKVHQAAKQCANDYWLNLCSWNNSDCVITYCLEGNM